MRGNRVLYGTVKRCARAERARKCQRIETPAAGKESHQRCKLCSVVVMGRTATMHHYRKKNSHGDRGTECAHIPDGVWGGLFLFGARGGGGTSHEKPTVPHQAQHHSTAQSPPFQISQRPCHLWYRHSAEEERYVRNKNDWDCHDAVSRNAQHKPEEEGIHSLRMWCGSSIPCVGVNAANEAA